MATLKVIAIPGVAQAGGFSGPNTGLVAANSDGTFTVDVRDIPFAYGAGYVPARTEHRFYYTPGAVASASAGLLFASAALSNGTKSIAANVDVMREVKAVVLPGTTAITAGTLTLTYDANDGTASQVDALDLTTALSTTKTVAASKGVLRMRSQIVTGLTGGSSPTFYIGSTAAIAVPVAPGAQDTAIVSEWLDNAIVTVANAGTISTAGIYTPNTAPNATHTFGVSYNTIAQ